LKQPSSSNDDIDSKVGANLKLLAQQANTVYSTPDMSKFTYDETSGYYYDYTTGFYYDSVSQYYFNPLTQQYMYWDALKSTYVPAPQGANNDDQNSLANSATNSENDEASKLFDSEKFRIAGADNSKEAKKTKTAAQIAKVTLNRSIKYFNSMSLVKLLLYIENFSGLNIRIYKYIILKYCIQKKEMEKWAQELNKKKDTKKIVPTSTTTITTTSVPSNSSITDPGSTNNSTYLDAVGLVASKSSVHSSIQIHYDSNYVSEDANESLIKKVLPYFVRVFQKQLKSVICPSYMF
jgi:hypothetical protein